MLRLRAKIFLLLLSELYMSIRRYWIYIEGRTGNTPSLSPDSISMRRSKLTCFFTYLNLKNSISNLLVLIYLIIILNIFQSRKTLLISCYTNTYCVGAGISTLMSISNRLRSYIFRRKMEKRWPRREEMNGKVFIHRQNWQFLFVDNVTEVPFPICTVSWRVNNYVSRQEKGIQRKNHSTKFKES